MAIHGKDESGYCEGVVGQFKEADVNFGPSSGTSNTPSSSTPTTTPLRPMKSRSRAGSGTSSSSDRKNQDTESSSQPRQTRTVPISLNPSVTERLRPRKLASEENLKSASAVETAGRRQILSLPPAPHPEEPTPRPEESTPHPGESAPILAIPPRSSSRQSKAPNSQRRSSGIQSLGTKSSSSSFGSVAEPYGSSATVITNPSEIKSNEPSPIPIQSRKGLASPDASSVHPLSFSLPTFIDTKAQQSPLFTTNKGETSPIPIVPSNKLHPFDRDERHRENDSYLSSVLDDIRSKTSRVLHMMSPDASLYGDHGSKEVDLRVVQMPASTPTDSPSLNVSLSTTSLPVMHSEAKTGPLDPGIMLADSPPPTRPETEAPGISSSATPEKEKPIGRPRSRSIRGGKPPRIFSLSDSSAGESSEPAPPTPSMFEKFRPWVKSGPRQRCNSGPAWHFDPDGQKSGTSDFKLHIPHYDLDKVPRQRRISEATVVSNFSTLTTQSKYRSKNWFGIGRRGSAVPAEDMRKPHPLGNGIEGGIVSPRLSPTADEDDEDDDSDDEDVEEDGAQRSAENSRIYINDYGFIYDLDDEMNQGQDLTGTGSTVGTSSLGSNVSTFSETERKKASRKNKRLRENELKWIHAATNLHVDNVKKSTKYKKLVRRGIPPSVRGRVWLFLAKADLYRKPGLFQELCKRGPLPIHEVIERDIHRCYPDHVHFRDGMGGTGQQDLHAVLKAYAHYKPSVGYCQGMGRLVGMMLMQMPVEDAFWLLVATIEGYMQDYYTPSLRQLKIDAQVFERLLKDQDPALADHLEKNDVIPLMYMTQWFMTLYTMSLPWASVLLVWDVFYYDGVKALFRVGLAILYLCRDHLLNKCPTSSELLAYILHIPLDILAPKPLLEAALQIRLKKQSVQKLIAVTAESMDVPPPSSSSSSTVTDSSKNTRKPVQRNMSTATSASTITSASTVSKMSANSSSTPANTDTQSVTSSPKQNSQGTTATTAITSTTPTTSTTASTVTTTTTTATDTAAAATAITAETKETTTATIASPPVSSPAPPTSGILGVFKTRKRALTIHK
ncbi:hypothetical protein BGX20_002537 [Mortierella sp. AD010]|nr:hypothetical protein BGX20_002537 [Mortierella sp. AD010]